MRCWGLSTRRADRRHILLETRLQSSFRPSERRCIHIPWVCMAHNSVSIAITPYYILVRICVRLARWLNFPRCLEFCFWLTVLFNTNTQQLRVIPCNTNNARLSPSKPFLSPLLSASWYHFAVCFYHALPIWRPITVNTAASLPATSQLLLPPSLQELLFICWSCIPTLKGTDKTALQMNQTGFRNVYRRSNIY